MLNKISRSERRKNRRLRLKSKTLGTAERPRLSVFKSNRYISIQLIDDNNQQTVLAASTGSKVFQERFKIKNYCNKTAAAHLGELLQESIDKKSIKRVIFDRSGYKFHGVIKSLIESAQKQGLKL